MTSLPRPVGGGSREREEAGDIREPESRTSQASTCLWKKMHREGQHRGKQPVPGRDRVCPGPGSLLGRSKDAAKVGGLRKPECPHTWEPYFLASSWLEIPTGPTLGKPPLGHLLTSLQGNPFPYRRAQWGHSSKNHAQAVKLR